MKIWTLLLLLLTLYTITCCERKSEDTAVKEQSISFKKSEKLDNQEVPERLLTFDTGSETNTTEIDINENLFGKFFCDRAEFFIINNPRNEIYSTKSESITLYYLDHELWQTKYVLRNNIASELLHIFGTFKIRGFDERNREIIKDKQVVLKTKNGITLNEKLDNYELTWTVGEKEVKYRANVGERNQFEYRERIKGYETKFRTISKSCI